MYSLDSLKDHFSSKVSSALIEIMNRDYVVSLVGGSVRDFALTGKLGFDLDFELTHKKKYSQDDWLKKLDEFNELLVFLGFKVIKSERFCVFKINIDEFSLEFATARTESFDSKSNKNGHSDVEVEFHSQIDSSLSFKRRDFTCNAVALKLSSEDKKITSEIEDPFDGLQAIEKKLLFPCDHSFIYDPVRFLRAVRFELKLNFKISEELYSYLSKMNLMELTHYYYLSESMKVNIFLFSKRFFSLTSKLNTPLAQRIRRLEYLGSFQEAPKLNSLDEIMGFLIAKNIDLLTLEHFRENIGMKKSTFKQMVKSARR